jgi:hypothetical protein
MNRLKIDVNNDNEHEDTEAVLMLPPDFPYVGLQAVSTILEKESVFVPGYIPPDVGLYHVDGFIYHAWVENYETVLLPDRNIVSRLAQIAKGESLANNRDVHSRKVAAILAFAQCLDIQIEPSIAFHELAPHQGILRQWMNWLGFVSLIVANPTSGLLLHSAKQIALKPLALLNQLTH